MPKAAPLKPTKAKTMMKFKVLGSTFSRPSNGGAEHFVRGDVLESETDLSKQFRNAFLKLADDSDAEPTPPRTEKEVREIKTAIQEGRHYDGENEPTLADFA